jgi:hypothetical protein
MDRSRRPDRLPGPRRENPFRKRSRPRQRACKPGSVPRGEPRGGGHLSGTAVTRRLKRPTRGHWARGSPGAPKGAAPAAWPCSGWGLPCAGALPPGRWALTPPFHPCLHDPGSSRADRRSVFCGPVHGSPRPGVTRHPAPLEPGLSSGREIPGPRPPGLLTRPTFNFNAERWLSGYGPPAACRRASRTRPRASISAP